MDWSKLPSGTRLRLKVGVEYFHSQGKYYAWDVCEFSHLKKEAGGYVMVKFPYDFAHTHWGNPDTYFELATPKATRNLPDWW